jgi:tetratricopeptide (TPR) repeat protein
VIEGKDPSSATLLLRCRARAQMGALPEALDDCDRALELNDSNARIYEQRGQVQVRLNDDAGALADYDAAIRLDRQSAVAYRGRAWVLMALERSPEGLLSFDRAVALDPNDYETRVGRLFWNIYLLDWFGTAFDASRVIALTARRN